MNQSTKHTYFKP